MLKLWFDRYINGKNNGFTTNDWQETHVFIYFVAFVQFLTRTIFVCGAFEDYPILDKICKIVTHQLHLLSTGDDRKFV